MAPYDIELGQNKFIGAFDEWTDVGTPKHSISKLEAKTQQFMTDQEIEQEANLNVTNKFRPQS